MVLLEVALIRRADGGKNDPRLVDRAAETLIKAQAPARGASFL
jgi:hypothetical protein